MSKKDIVISQGQRPLLHRFIAAGCYTLAGFCIYRGVVVVEDIVTYASLGTFLIMFALRYSIVKYYYFDFKNKRYRDMSTIGSIEWGSWTSFEELNYVAVFRSSKDMYEVNFWYDTNRHFNFFMYEELEDALLRGKEIATTLELHLYDAGTDRYNGQWIEI